MTSKKTTLLCILDGWGIERGDDFDAISKANTPVFDELLRTCPNSTIKTYGEAVGLPAGQMGNSEVGHMNIGGGRLVLQSLPKIDNSFNNGEFKGKVEVQEQIKSLKAVNGSIHVMGLLSDGGVHAHIDHIIKAAKNYANEGINVKIHAFTDGRDTSPSSATKFVEELLNEIESEENISLSTISGRYYAMDRDQRWERVEKAYNAIAHAKSIKFSDPIKLLENSYNDKITDEFIIPASNDSYEGIKDGDGVLMVNFRADRAREILETILYKNFDHFDRGNVKNISSALGMVEYSEDLNEYLKTIFPAEKLSNTLGEVLSNHGMTQLRIAETEKYAHITFFFNGGAEDVYEGEDRILVPSPDVATYDLKPEMSAPEVTEKLIQAIESGKYDLIVCNYANPDMVGHTGVMNAAVKAVETIDKCLEKLTNAIKENNGTMLITADHGNIEQMVDEKGRPHTQHTVGCVPLILYGNSSIKELSDGRLCDLAPTILELKNIDKPLEMNGLSLIK